MSDDQPNSSGQNPSPPGAEPGTPPQPPTQQWATPPPPTAGFHPTTAPNSRRGYGYGYGRRGRASWYPVLAGVLSILVSVVSAATERNGGHFSFLIVLPVLGLLYGIVSIVQGQGSRRAMGIIGSVLCALALLIDLLLAVF